MGNSATDRLRDKIRKLHALLGSNNANEREAARAKIDEILAKNKKNWNDLTELLFTGNAQGWQDDDAGVDEQPTDQPRRPAPLDLIYHVLERYLRLTEHQLVAITLWIVHTFILSVTPRLIVTSPTQGCGKSTVLELVAALGFRTHLTDNLTVATLFRRIDRDRSAVLIDEADNQNLSNDPTLRAVINGGYRSDRRVERYIGGELVEFSIYAPLALATINTRLPLPTLRRSIVIHMERSSVALARFDPKRIPDQQADCDIVYRETLMWAQRCTLNPDPSLPEVLLNRPADKWRVLVSIADACSEEWGRLARGAAIALSKYQDEDFSVLLLSGIRDIFDRRPSVDRLASARIVAELNDMTDAPWCEWRGPQGDQAPRQLSQAQMAHILAPFGIRPKTIWPSRRDIASKSSKGYFRKEFERAWASYCDGTPAQRSNIRYLDASRASQMGAKL